MTNIANIPLEDAFKTSLSQQWTGWLGTVNVTGTPNFTFPSGITTYIVVNPGKSNMQIATINAYDSSAKTLTVSDITLEKGAWVNSTAWTHSVWSEVIISDNYQFWSDILTAVNSKVDWDTQPFPSYTTTNRDLISASNWMMIYNTTTWEFNLYQWWAWSAVASGSTQPDASTTVAGKVEIATDAEVWAWTSTWLTWAILSLSVDNSSKTQVTNKVPVLDSNGQIIPFINSQADWSASLTEKWLVELATDAEAAAWTDETRYINSKQVKDNYAPLITDVLIWPVGMYTTNATISAWNQWVYMSFADATGHSVYGTVLVPKWMTAISSVKVVYENAATSTNLVFILRSSRRRVWSAIVNDTDWASNIYATSWTAQVESITLNADWYNGIWAVVEYDILWFTLFRQWADANDTYGVALDVYWILVTFS